MKAACTIINEHYVPFAKVLHRSLARFLPDLPLEVLVVDREGETRQEEGIVYTSLSQVMQTKLARDIFNKYAHTNADHLRWSLKPVSLLYLLEKYEQVIYMDADIYFTGDPSFLFKKLETHPALLAPHWSEVNPLKYEDGLYSVMRNGLYSGGFIGVSRDARPALQWWAEACHYKMEKNAAFGLYDDQKYLDLFPLLLENTALIRHPGCNLTNINLLTCRRSVENGKLLINGKEAPVFIHFTHDTIHNIRAGNDTLLRPYLEEYIHSLQQNGSTRLEPMQRNYLREIKSKSKLRTRVKRWLFRMAEKI